MRGVLPRADVPGRGGLAVLRLPDLEAIADQLARTNASFGRDEQIRKVVVASPRPSIANGMLTSQFKPRRQAIFAAFQAEITNNQDGIHAQ